VPSATLPDFPAVLDDGSTTSLSALLENGPVVLFFYPKAFTPGCTAESCHFRDLAAEFAEIGAQRIGISRDDVRTQARFRADHGLDFPLIADEDGSVAQVFGAKRMGPLPSKRQTFVIDTDRTLVKVISSELNMQVHAEEALDALRAHRGADDLRVEIALDEPARAEE
jgi:thioredoxin-dependent peroxiredoxin